MSEHLRRAWVASRAFRTLLVVALVYTALRLAAHGIYLANLLTPEDLPDWAASETSAVPVDLQTYLDAADHFRQRQPLYNSGTIKHLEGLYQYSPAFALAFIPFLWLTPSATAIVHTVLHILAYAGLYLLWWTIFHELGLDRSEEMMAWTLPVWLVFSAFWSDLGYLNLTIIVALLASLLLHAVLRERLALAVLCLTAILMIKPMWAFAAVLPLLTGHWKFFLRLVAFALLAQFAVAGVTALAGGFHYASQQVAAYVRFLFHVSRNFPWRGPESGFLGYNHSVRQVVLYLAGANPTAWSIATGVKCALLAPLGIIAARGPARAESADPATALELGFLLYLGAFLWLDMVWEVSLGIAIFVYLLGTEPGRGLRALIWCVFLPYALTDFWQLLSFLILGENAMLPGPYFITDPSIYIPIVMIVILVFYAVLVRRRLKGRATALGTAGGMCASPSQPLQGP